jgi:protein-tyrosine-phosphatase
LRYGVLLMSQPDVLRVLILCTGNSARSQIAEALINRKGAGRMVAGSAGSQPAPRVNPYAVRALGEAGIEWHGHEPQGIDAVFGQPWDLIITVCDRAKESCPVFPGRPVTAHWGMPDPADVQGSEEQKLAAFRDTLNLLARRIDLLLALPREKLERFVFEQRVRAIGTEH